MKMKNKYDKYVIFLIIILCSLILQRKYINDFPSHIHAWTQSDRYALSLGFIKNNFDFFHPQTYVLNHQFPGNFRIPSDNSITAVEFPIHDFIAALIMKLFHTTSPWCYQLYILLYSCIGWFYLYKIGTILKISVYHSALLILILASSPVFAYYQAGFLPTIPSIANGFIGLYFYLKYLTSKEDLNPFYWGIGFLSLASLSRTPFSILLITVISLEFLQALKWKKIDPLKIFVITISIAVIVGYHLYNNYLRVKYGSLFLNSTLMPQSFQEVKQILKIVKGDWLFQYFSKMHYTLFIALILISFYQFAIIKINITCIQKQIFYIFSVILLGSILYSFLMLKQFCVHDYYFLDTFFTPISLLILLLLSIISTIKIHYIKGFITFILSVTTCFLILHALRTQQIRRQTYVGDIVEQTIKNFQDSKKFLDSLQIPSNAKILDLCSFAPNIPFILMDRKGYTTLSSSKENIIRELTWKFDFIVLQNELFLSDVYSNYPDIVKRIEKVADNGHISIYKLSSTNKDNNLLNFLGLKDKVPFLKNGISFDTTPTEGWQNTNSTTIVKHLGTSCGVVTPQEEYGITFKLNNLNELNKRSMLLYLTSFYLENNKVFKQCNIVVTITSQKENLFYKSYDLASIIKPGHTWTQVNLTFPIPQINNKELELGIYIWNKGHNLLYYDDIEFQLY